jgi:diketogulonate reductase-like aldo/keto reductase
VDAIAKVAEARDVPMAQVALAWVLSKPVISCPIVGATKPNHLRDAVGSLDLELADREITGLEESYTPTGQLLVVTPAAVAGEIPSMASPATAGLWRHGRQAAVNVNCPEGTVKTV